MREKEPYIKLPIRYLHETDWYAAIIRAYIDGFIHSGKPLFQTQDDMARTLHCSRKTINDKSELLRNQGLIQAKKTQKGFVYSDVTESYNGMSPRVTSDVTESYNGMSPRVTSDVTESYNDNKDDIKVINNTINKKSIGDAPTAEIISISELVLIKWNEHYTQHFNTGYVPDYRSLTNDKDLISDAVKNKMQDFKKNPDNADEAAEFIQAMFEAMFSAADKWQKEHWTLHTVATQFNQLYNAIINRKNGNNNSNNNGGITDDYIARKMREAGLL